MYKILLSGDLERSYQIDPKDSWLLAAAEKNLPMFVPGWKDSTLGNMYAGHCISQDVKEIHTVRTGIEYMIELAEWYTATTANVTDACNLTLKPETDLAVSFLPLAHVYGRMLDYAYIFQGCPVAYVEVVENVAQALLEVKPTILAAVPRFFEKIYARLMEKGTQNQGLKRKIFDFGMRTARESAAWRSGDKAANIALKLKWVVADKLVYSKVRAGTRGRLVS